MADYIKREDAIQANVSQVEFCKSEGLDFSGKLHIDSVINNLKHIPAADVVARKTGEWVNVWHNSFRAEVQMCSNCKGISAFKTNFCPNCGAEMKGESQ